MATKADFSDEEWTAMQKGVTGAGALVSLGDRRARSTVEERDRFASVPEEAVVEPSTPVKRAVGLRSDGERPPIRRRPRRRCELSWRQ